ncbi:MerR family transcriptional regulator [Microbacterium sp. LB16]|uniref:MerR family transcriptional regulator n=1 Tax=unclassified Microbacterium TaxID=2609290 RepID=UPI003FA596BA
MTLRIAEVSQRSGVPSSTLRYYDQIGLVPSGRASNGYRSYSEDVLDRLRFIDAARRLDLPLAEIGELLDSWESEACLSVKARLRPRLDEHVARVEETIAGLSDLREALRSARVHLDELPDRDQRCDPSCAFLLKEPPPPVACSLGEGREQQIAAWRELLSHAELHRIPGGVTCSLPVARLAEATELAAAEQACCPFFGFELILRGNTFNLAIRSPVDALPLLAELTGLELVAVVPRSVV